MSISRFIVLFFISTLVFVACSTKPSSVLDDKKMIAILEDLYVADAMMKNRRDEYKSDKYKDALINSVLAKHEITQAQLDSSLVWYADNIEHYSAIQDTVSARLQRRSEWITTFNANHAYNFKLTGFDVELPKNYVLDVNTPTFRFKIDSLRMREFEKEKWEFSFNTQGVDTTFHNLESSVYYKYADTIVVDKRKILGDSLYIFTKPQLADSLLKEISGYVHMLMATDKMPKVLLSNIKNKEQNIVVPTDTIAEASETELLNEMLDEQVVR